jgi:chemotaxis response regulator CheB
MAKILVVDDAAFIRMRTLQILAGMGRDGAMGEAAVEAAGGRIIDQDQGRSVIYGMSKAARQRTCHSTEGPLGNVANTIAWSVKRAIGNHTNA